MTPKSSITVYLQRQKGRIDQLERVLKELKIVVCAAQCGGDAECPNQDLHLRSWCWPWNELNGRNPSLCVIALIFT